MSNSPTPSNIAYMLELTPGQTAMLMGWLDNHDAEVRATAQDAGYEGGLTEASQRLQVENVLLDRLRVAAVQAYKGPHDTDVSCLRGAARRLKGGYQCGGSNTQDTVARVLLVVAEALDA